MMTPALKTYEPTILEHGSRCDRPGTLSWLAAAAALLLAAPAAWGISPHDYVTTTDTDNSLALATDGQVAAIVVDAGDDWGVRRAADDLAADFGRVTGVAAPVVTDAASLDGPTIIAGTLGRSALIDHLADSGAIDVAAIRDEWEAFHIELVDQPVDGVPQALVIAGSDRRGAIFGIYDLAEQIGVSPWHFWADVPAKRAEALYVKAGTRIQDAPRVQYRGIFLNDEAPALTGWVQENYGDFTHEFYVHVFELILRLKGNFLWPAMWNNAFADDDEQNMVLADRYGIVMSTSHHEPMMRADKEWDRHGEGPWDYARNPENLRAFWRAGAERNKPYESIWTIGMRGQQDTPMSETEDIDLLETIVAAQRDILADVFTERDITGVPQVWALYKEVQSYYEHGMRVPEDVILLWSDDNWGNIRRLPTPAERERSGGAGVYYHFDYVGGPRSYRWINVTQIAKVREQMNLADAYGAHRIWLVNVGDLKPMEYPIEFFLDIAWNVDNWPKERVPEYGQRFAERVFGPEHADEIAELLEAYTRHNARRKPELQAADTYSLLHYREAERIEAELEDLAARAETLYAQMDAAHRPAFFQLVYYPVVASGAITRMYIAQARNRLHAAQGRATTNRWAERTRELFELNAELAERFHGPDTRGKWNHMMSQPRIGYTHWNNPPADTQPAVVTNRPNAVADMGVAVEGMAAAWPAEDHEYALPDFHRHGADSRRIEVFNKGTEPFEFTARASEPWIVLDRTGSPVEVAQAVNVSVDWDRVPEGASEGHVIVQGTGWGDARVAVTAHRPPPVSLAGYLEADGHLSMPADGFSARGGPDGLGWDVIPGLGRTGSAVAVFPVTDRTFGDDPAGAPWVAYEMTLFTAGDIRVETAWSPTRRITPGRGQRFAIALDGEPPQLVDLHADRAHRRWQESVRNAVHKAVTTHRVDTPGRHTLRIYGIDPAITLQDIVVDTGGLAPSYLGPPPSRHADDVDETDPP